MAVEPDDVLIDSVVESSLSAHVEPTGQVLNVLTDVQARFRYIPQRALVKLSEETGVPLSDLHAVCSFFKDFSLDPVGEYLVMVCDGTACHTKGSVDIIQALEVSLRIKVGETTPDGRFTLRAVNCVGACGLAPIVVMNTRTFGRVRLAEATQILKFTD